jgi:hypothetical protein
MAYGIYRTILLAPTDNSLLITIGKVPIGSCH